MKALFRLTTILLTMSFAGLILGLVSVMGVYLSLKDELPEINQESDFALEVPLRIYSVDGLLMGEYGAQRRTPVEYNEIPDQLVKAFISAEDDRFFEHPGVDYQGLIRAVLHTLQTGGRGQGGSTITMQVARNFFLTPEKSYKRKLLEIFLALQIERELTKKDILALYLNKIYLGKRAYGVAAAGQVYYGKNLDELSVAQIAMIAGLPKAPSTYNPIVNPDRALLRRNYVLRRMNELGHLDQDLFEAGKAESISANLQAVDIELSAGYITEMVRAQVLEKYGYDAYSMGLKVYATVRSQSQTASDYAIRKALQDYDTRHGYRGPVKNLLKGGADVEVALSAENIDAELRKVGSLADLLPAVVTTVSEQSAQVITRDHGKVTIDWAGIEWARQQLSTESMGPRITAASEVLRIGDVVYLLNVDPSAEQPSWRVAQKPAVEGAFVALNPADGAILAMSGGYDYYASKFNRASQARRQPGSSIKPFLYSAALDKGYSAATIINDAPVVFENDGQLETAWRPENYSGRFYGPTRLRKALINSRNLVSIRIARDIGVSHFINYLTRFGFERDALPRDLSLALGSASTSPMNLAEAYATFANGGYKVKPYLISKITESTSDKILWQSEPDTVCDRKCVAWQDSQEEEWQLQLDAWRKSNPQFDELTFEDIASKEPDQETGEDSDMLAVTPPPEKPSFLPRAQRIIPETNWYIINSMLQDVVRRGTATRAKSLGRNDIGGKTGTTNDQKDAWFAGFNPYRVGIAWVGFDQVQTLGKREVGGRAALPMWIEFMKVELADIPDVPLQQPNGVTTIRISSKTGKRVGADAADAMFEIFRVDNIPEADRSSQPPKSPNDDPYGYDTKDGGGSRYSDEDDLF
jgi:penicillin-binding protein 1A